MSTLTAIRRARKDAGDTNDSQFLRIELRNGEIIRFTDAQLDLTTSISNQGGVEVAIDPVTYYSLMAFDLSAVGSSAESVGEIDLEGVLLPLGYTREQIAEGIFDNARVYVFLSDRERPVEDDEKLFSGFWGENTMIDGRYIAKFVSLISVFQADTSRIISQLCDAKLGSDRCGVKLTTTARDGSEVGAVPEPSNPGDPFVSAFDPLTEVNLEAWYDWSDNTDLVLGGNGIVRAVDKTGNNGTANGNHTVASINGRQAVNTAVDGLISLPSPNPLNSHDIYIIAKPVPDISVSGPLSFFRLAFSSLTSFAPYFDTTSNATIYQENTVNFGTIVTDVEINKADMSGISMMDAYNNHLKDTPFLLKYSHSSSSSVNVSGFLGDNLILGEIFVVNRTTNTPAQILGLETYISEKWELNLFPDALATIEDISPYDARTRVITESPSAPYFWFESQSNGTLGASEPVWNQNLGGETIDNEVTWLSIPARVINLTCQVGQGLDRLISVNETLPAGFEDQYISGRLEFMSGLNKGAAYVVMANDLTSFTLNLATLIPTEAGDEIQITVACNKSKTYCDTVYRNGTNFQGFDNLPSRANIFRVGDK